MRTGFAALVLSCSLSKILCRSPEPVALVRHVAPSSYPSVSPELFAELEELARLVDITYCVGILGLGIQKPFECPSRCGEFDDFELVTVGVPQTWNTGPLLSDSCGYIALSHPPNTPRIVIAFRGTYSITNTVADLSSIPQQYMPYPGDKSAGDAPTLSDCANCTVHTGFYTSWLHARTEILPHVYRVLDMFPDYNVTLVGHSLGGAVAAFAGLEMLARRLNPTVTTFGEPRVGNKAFADYIGLRFNLASNSTDNLGCQLYRRVTHVSDPVPLLPFDEWGYTSHAGEIYISNPIVPPGREDLHHCAGGEDPACSSGAEGSASLWTIPPRFNFWQLFFAHRDYFWRLGLCIPTSDHFWRGDGLERQQVLNQ